MDYLDKTKTKCLRGLLAILILLHHTLQYMENSSAFYPKGMGYLFVAVFYFISGYGLMQSFNANENYLDHFIKKRLPKLYRPFLIATVLYLLVKYLLGHHYSIESILLSLVGGLVIVNFSWYIFSILLFYLAFYLSYHFLHGKLSFYAMSMFTILYTVCACMVHLEVWWYISSFAFILGIVWCKFKSNIDDFIKTHYSIVLVLALAVFIANFLNLLSRGCSSIIHVEIIIKGIFLLEYFVSSLSFCVLTLLVIMKTDIDNKVLLFLGGLSGEIYLMQGLAVKELKGTVFYINNNILYLFCVIGITFCFSILLKKLDRIFSRSSYGGLF